MSTVTVVSRANGVVNSYLGKTTGDGAALTVSLGFKPAFVAVYNETDAIVYEWNAGMAATKSFKFTGTPGFTVDTGSAIVDNGDGTITLAAAVNVNAKLLTIVANA